MPAKSLIDPDQWENIRYVWEHDPRDGYAWLVKELGLSVSPETIRKRVRVEGWSKRIKPNAGKRLRGTDPIKTPSTENSPKPPTKGGAKSKRPRATGPDDSVDMGKGKRGAGGRSTPPASSPKAKSKTHSKKEPVSKASAQKRAFKKTELPPQGTPKGDAKKGTTAQAGRTFGASKSSAQDADLDIERDLGGRPTAYRPEFAQQAYKLALMGATDEKIADFFLVSTRTLYRWKWDYPEFCHALSAGKTMADADVALALYNRAIGLKLPKIHVSSFQGRVSLTKIYECIPGDVGAQRTWLFNRQADLWRAEPEPERVGDDGKMPDADEMEEVYQESHTDSIKKRDYVRDRYQRFGFGAGATIATDAKIKKPPPRADDEERAIADDVALKDAQDDAEGEG